MRRISAAYGTKKKHRPRICSEAPMRRLFPEPSAKGNLFFFLFKVIISQHSPVRSSFQTCRHNKPNFFFPSFSQVCNQSVSSFFFIFSSKDNYNTGRAALQTQIQKGTHMSNTQTDTFRQNTHTNRHVFVCIGQFSKGTVRSKKTPLWLANRKVTEKTLLLGSVKFSYREKIIIPLT